MYPQISMLNIEDDKQLIQVFKNILLYLLAAFLKLKLNKIIHLYTYIYIYAYIHIYIYPKR